MAVFFGEVVAGFVAFIVYFADYREGDFGRFGSGGFDRGFGVWLFVW